MEDHKQVLALVVAAAMLSGCSLRTMAINTVADSLVAAGDVYASDDDPELIRQALPFALKTIESLLAEQPENRKLLLAACRGFAQYSYAFVDTHADSLESVDYRASLAERERALKLYLRARDYGLRSLELESPGIGRRLEVAPETALAAFGVDEVPLLYWTGAAWGGAISLGKDRPELSADLPAVRALIERSLELDPDYNLGAAHSVMIVLEALPEAMGGSPERARDHFEQAVALSRGLSAGPYVTLAKQVSVPAQDWREFQQLLEQALDIDPDGEPSLRLMNIIVQDQARTL
ncbi:MAG: TRAP transporter TatT component family protein, partial [Thermoanaerobaculia bacterium]